MDDQARLREQQIKDDYKFASDLWNAESLQAQTPNDYSIPNEHLKAQALKECEEEFRKFLPLDPKKVQESTAAVVDSLMSEDENPSPLQNTLVPPGEGSKVSLGDSSELELELVELADKTPPPPSNFHGFKLNPNGTWRNQPEGEGEESTPNTIAKVHREDGDTVCKEKQTEDAEVPDDVQPEDEEEELTHTEAQYQEVLEKLKLKEEELKQMKDNLENKDNPIENGQELLKKLELKDGELEQLRSKLEDRDREIKLQKLEILQLKKKLEQKNVEERPRRPMPQDNRPYQEPQRNVVFANQLSEYTLPGVQQFKKYLIGILQLLEGK